MATAQLTSVLRRIRKLADLAHQREWTDRELLEEFLTRHDEKAFAALVQRHGAMVLRVCRRVLRREQDAEDAFQATFLVLVRNADSIRKRDALASWLHGVAYRVAMKAKQDAGRRRTREREVGAMSQTIYCGEADWKAVQTILDEEIQRLPAKYRNPFVLCFVEGRSRAEAARELGLKEGTVWSRLSQARKQLQQRLSRRGVSLSVVLGAAGLVEGIASAVPPSLVASTVRAAGLLAAGQVTAVSAKVAALTEGLLKAMIVTKLKSVSGLLLAVAVIAGMTSFIWQQGGAAQEPVEKPPVQARAKPAGKERRQPAPAVLKTDGAVWRMAWSPKGLLVTASANGEDAEVEADGKKRKVRFSNTTVEVWQIATAQRKLSLGEEKKVNVDTVACSADGKTAALGATIIEGMLPMKREVRLIDLDNGSPRSIEELEGLHLVAFSPDGKMLACGGRLGDDPAHRVVRFWDAQKGKVTIEIKEKVDIITAKDDFLALLYSPDGKRLATASVDGKIALWDTKTGTSSQTLETDIDATVGANEYIAGLAFSPDGKILAIAGSHGRLKLFDTHTGKEKQTLSIKGKLSSIAYSPDGSLLVTGGEGECIIWDAQTGEQKRSLRDLANLANCWVFSVAFSPDGQTLATGVTRYANAKDEKEDPLIVGGEVKLWQIKELLEPAAKGTKQLKSDKDENREQEEAQEKRRQLTQDLKKTDPRKEKPEGQAQQPTDETGRGLQACVDLSNLGLTLLEQDKVGAALSNISQQVMAQVQKRMGDEARRDSPKDTPEEQVKKLNLVEVFSERTSLATQPTAQAPAPPVIHFFKGQKNEVRVAPGQAALVELPKPARDLAWEIPGYVPEGVGGKDEALPEFDYVLCRWNEGGKVVFTAYKKAAAKQPLGKPQKGVTQIFFSGPAGAKLNRLDPPAAPHADGQKALEPKALEIPGHYEFERGKTHRLKLSKIPKRAGLFVYPTLEVPLANPQAEAFLAHNSVRVVFTEEDLDTVAAGDFLTKVVYLPEPNSPVAAAVAAGELISPRVDPGVDVIAEARRQGQILAIVRLGNIDLQVDDPAKKDGHKRAEFEDVPVNTLKVTAILDAIDAKNRTITVTLSKRTVKGTIIRNGNDADIDVEGDALAVSDKTSTKLANLRLAKDAMITSGQQQMKLTELKAGMHVMLQLRTSNIGQIAVAGVEISDQDHFLDIEIQNKESIPVNNETKPSPRTRRP